jgi:hypothetical protein
MEFRDTEMSGLTVSGFPSPSPSPTKGRGDLVVQHKEPFLNQYCFVDDLEIDSGVSVTVAQQLAIGPRTG